jgi:single-strand DNA-binding protein
MAGWQQTIIVGNVGRDPRFQYTQSGIAVCDFSVAVTRRFGGRDNTERQEKTTWFRVTCWRNLAEIARDFVHKGTQIMVVGSIDASAYTDKGGQPAASLDLTADNFQLLGSRDGQGQGQGQPRGDYNDFAPPADDIGDIPF